MLTEWFDPVTIVWILAVACLVGFIAAVVQDYREGR